MTKLFAVLLLILLAAGRGEGALAAQAQGPAAMADSADSAGLARAVASVLADSVLARLRSCDPAFIERPNTPFDSAVAVLLNAVEGVRPFVPAEASSSWVGTRGFVMRGDTAAVLTVFGTYDAGQQPIDTYIEENHYLFVRDLAGWRYVRREFVRGMDLGPVRG